MAFQKTYHIVPTLDMLPPPAGPLGLGAILAAPNEVSRPLDSFDQIEVPSQWVTTVIERDWRKTISSDTEVYAGVYATVLQLSNTGMGLSMGKTKLSEDRYAFDSLKTVSFEPEDEWVAQLVRFSAPVQQYMEGMWYSARRPVYMVTGYMAVKGSRFKNTTSKSWTASSQLGVDLTSAGLPVQIGPQSEVKRGRTEETERTVDDEILFAYRIREVKLKKGGVVRTKAHNRGALLDAADDKSEDEPVFKLDHVMHEDFTGASERHSPMVTAIDEGTGDLVNLVTTATRGVA